jgi:putative intracellular protease/amidase
VAKVLIPVPARDSDPSEVAVSWQVLTEAGHEIVFASPDGDQARCDELMVSAARALTRGDAFPVFAG